MILAHAERYRCLTEEPELAEQLGDMGIPAPDQCRKHYRGGRQKDPEIHQVSDGRRSGLLRGNRRPQCQEPGARMKKAAEYVKKKYGEEYVRKIFYEMPR